MRLVLVASVAGLCGFGFGGCRPQDDPRTGGRVRELNEIPLAQLRVMLRGYAGDWRSDGALMSEKPEPPKQKEVPVGAPRIALPRTETSALCNLSVGAAIAQRRSVRNFSSTGISKDALACLLWATQGVTRVDRDESGNVVQQYRVAPSAGGRYPLETYLAVRQVDGLPGGLYRYLPNTHELLLLRVDETVSIQMRAACYGDSAVGDAAVVFIWSATPGRTEWKYTYLAHRMIAMEAGHVCQNLYLAAQSCGLGVCALLSYHQPQVDKLLGLDGGEEFTLYLAGVGKAEEPTR